MALKEFFMFNCYINTTNMTDCQISIPHIRAQILAITVEFSRKSQHCIEASVTLCETIMVLLQVIRQQDDVTKLSPHSACFLFPCHQPHDFNQAGQIILCLWYYYSAFVIVLIKFQEFKVVSCAIVAGSYKHRESHCTTMDHNTGTQAHVLF